MGPSNTHANKEESLKEEEKEIEEGWQLWGSSRTRRQGVPRSPCESEHLRRALALSPGRLSPWTSRSW